MNHHQFWIELLQHEMNNGKIEQFNSLSGWIESRLIEADGQVNFRTSSRWRKKSEPKVIVEHRDKEGYRCCLNSKIISTEAVIEHCQHYGGTLHRYVEDLDYKPDNA